MSARIAAIILAAGESRRMGRFKPLLPIGAESILEREIRMFREAGIKDIRVVAGHQSCDLIPVLKRLSVIPIVNPDYRTGMLSSIRAGVASLEGAIDAFFLLPADIPLVRTDTVRRLVRRFAEGVGKILYPTFRERRGHPPLISAALSPGILSYRGEGGLRGFLETCGTEAAGVPVPDRHILFDVDTPGDYEKLKIESARHHIPSEEECRVLLCERFGTDAPLLRHAGKVADLSRSLATALGKSGVRLDPDLLSAAALLHDIAAGRKDHAREGARILRKLGFDAVADVVSSHMDLDLRESSPIDAREVLYLADKLVREDRPVELQTRLEEKLKEYGDDPDAREAVLARFGTARLAEKRFEAATGDRLAHLISGSPSTFVPPLLGGHFSIAGGLHKAFYIARDYGCNTLQVFTKNANAWKERQVTEEEIRSFDAAREETGIRLVFSHTSYLINPAAGPSEMRALSREALRRELLRSALLGIPFVVLHPGSHTGAGEAAGIRLTIEMLNEVFEATPGPMPRLLLETTAGQGSGIGHTFEQIARLLDGIARKERVGVCLDTCHVFAAGYDIRSEEGYAETMSSFLDIVGPERLFLIHMNDSKKELGGRVDRHAHIGEGAIGIAAFARIMNDARLIRVPKIIETPKGKNGEDFDRMNLGRLRDVFTREISEER